MYNVAHVHLTEGTVSQASIGTTSRHWPARMRGKVASQYLLEVHGVQLGPNTLAKLRVVGGSPPFQYDGRFPVYTPAGLDGFAIDRLGPERRSTSDTGQESAA
jgi:hypothetical protein